MISLYIVVTTACIGTRVHLQVLANRFFERHLVFIVDFMQLKNEVSFGWTHFIVCHEAGLMEHADAEKVARIRQILRSAMLPQKGNALDFGCGSGAYTAIIKEELPGWNIYGTDLSSIALDKAKQRVPAAVFEM